MTRDELVLEFSKKYTPEQTEVFQKAVDFATSAHASQLRESGELYIVHPIEVARMVMEMGMDAASVTAAILHDVVEDGDNITVDDLQREFGAEIANLVDGVTKLTKSGQQTYITKKQEQSENLRKLFLAIAADVRVVIIKLADRLHNMRTLAYCNPYKRTRKAKETLEVYAPLAHRFGMGAIKGEMEDLCFMYLMPEEYANISRQFKEKQTERQETLDDAKRIIGETLKEAGIEASISGRPKHLYSVYKKMQRLNSGINEVYDLIAIRVIVDSVNDCYAALGVIHAGWKPLPGRFKDYIATPKPNMYRSLHTTLLAPNGIPFEVQIRTKEMHRTAEYGIAAHWMYKEGRTVQSLLDKKTSWLRQVIEAKENTEDSREFVESIMKDFLGEYVFVLTPRGEIIDLPVGSTPLDFAYRIHTNIGHHCQGAKVNGSLVRLDYKLKTNDVVEIVTSNSQQGPSRDWLKIVKTQSARNKIRQWFKKENREENIARGRDMLEDAAKRQTQQLAELMKPEYVSVVLNRMRFTSIEDIYSAIGFGGISANNVLHKFMELKKKSDKVEELAEKIRTGEGGEAAKTHVPVNGIVVKGDPGMAVRFGNCCNPLPGDPIIGYITRGRGVSVHRADCPNVSSLRTEADRIIDVEWAINTRSAFNASLQIEGDNRPGTLSQISATLSGLNISIQSINGRPVADGRYIIEMMFEVANTEQLNVIIKNIKKLKCVSEVYRMNR
ncbi:MAG: bifunctional (p)ppGpp synthetase/guanosine-3',5'-bis(diphosphate) 3'-pyrophosphohydrolase [Clostridiaceae bacterium]|nr:bifunctional (p)ppGpp synthetase/guanosine-3',5'-bis(diphosphate) 3'-pyrophosphohydrolase [Feifaniaceae bacterium]